MKEHAMPRSTRIPLTQAKRQQLTEHPRGGTSELASGPIGFRFSEVRHHLTPQECKQANQRLRRLERTRPILEKGVRWQAKQALRVAGVLSAVKRGLVGNSGWGRSMLATQGGLALK